ncbi:hypothetical protein C8R46DRAFT_1275989 [Mycena filopes]|nr:hypothetical protein C8R46DRAFT_1275989 [Mycena filopes]
MQAQEVPEKDDTYTAYSSLSPSPTILAARPNPLRDSYVFGRHRSDLLHGFLLPLVVESTSSGLEEKFITTFGFKSVHAASFSRATCDISTSSWIRYKFGDIPSHAAQPPLLSAATASLTWADVRGIPLSPPRIILPRTNGASLYSPSIKPNNTPLTNSLSRLLRPRHSPSYPISLTPRRPHISMDALFARFEAERIAGELTDTKILNYMADILQNRGFRALDIHGNLFGRSGAATPPPARNDAFVLAKRDAFAYLQIALSERAAGGWAAPSMLRIEVKIDNMPRAWCVLYLNRPTDGEVETLLVRSLQEFHHVL